MKRTAQVALAVLALGLGAGGELRAQAPAARPAAELYLHLRDVGLDAGRVYRIRDARIDREDLHLSFNEGVIAFTEAVDGRITGAFFAGDGDVLLRPPDHAERWALSVFTRAAVLEERFSSAYLRFNDDLFEEVQPALRPLEPGEAAAPEKDDEDEPPAVTAQAFIVRWNPTAKALGSIAAERLLVTFVNAGLLAGDPRADVSPRLKARASTARPGAPTPLETQDRLLYCRIAGTHLGVFDVMYDTQAAEQIIVAQASSSAGGAFYDYWTSFPMRSARARFDSGTKTAQTQAAAESAPQAARITAYKIRARVKPPRELQAETTFDIVMGAGGQRMLRFELSRFLKVNGAWLGEQALEVVQNEALEGSALAQRGNDVVGVVFPRPLLAGERVQLRLSYAGEVLSDAGGGLIYVGARGSWYPNHGPAMTDFDLEFHYPAGWTLVATGKRVAAPAPAGDAQSARFVSERPLPLAGFNIGQYVKAMAPAAGATVETYATRAMESTFDAGTVLVLVPGPKGRPTVITVPKSRPTPAVHAQAVAEQAARAVNFFSERLGPFPYSTLTLAQMPGGLSQGWPGLIYLSSYVFVSPEERRELRLGELDDLVSGHLTTAHETAHQWWGDLLLWNSYREQWLSEALANYCALLLMKRDRPGDFTRLLEHYRSALLATTKEGRPVGDAGPVTLGFRLNSARFPGAYETIVYGRGTWLFHMLREMLGEAPGSDTAGDAAFFAVLRRLRDQFEGREIYTRDVQRAFEQALPAAVRYEGRKSLDWFFDSWVNGTAVPHLELKDVKFGRGEHGVTVSGKIVQTDAPPEFVTSVPLYGESGGGKRVLLGRVFAEGAETAFRLTAPPSTRRVLLDPYRAVLRR